MTKQTYWESNGKYQTEADILQTFVPVSGESYDTRIELFRCASHIYYDMFNNGMCNCVEGSEWYDVVSSKIDMGYVEDFMEVYRKEQEKNNLYDDLDYDDNSKSESMFHKACEAMDLVMDRVIEHIKSTGFFEVLKK